MLKIKKTGIAIGLLLSVVMLLFTLDDGIKTPAVIGMHTSVRNDISGLKLLSEMKALSEKGVNLIIVQVDYDYQYTSRPELANKVGLSFEMARKIGNAGKAYGIRIVPEIDCLGHQSAGSQTSALLRVYPELDETPGMYPQNEGIYARSWCPLNEAVNPIIFDLMDELIDAFEADAFHVGMDEVFLIGSSNCPRCHGHKPADLFARAVADLHSHLVEDKHVEMLMWADRFLDGYLMGDVYGEYEVAYNETAGALLKIPRDIILCDWHYSTGAVQPSMNHFMFNNFRVLTASFDNVAAAKDLVNTTIWYRSRYPNVLGHLYTTWSTIDNDRLSQWPPMVQTVEMLKEQP